MTKKKKISLKEKKTNKQTKKQKQKITNGTIKRLIWLNAHLNNSSPLNFRYETLLKYCKTLNSNIFDKT